MTTIDLKKLADAKELLVAVLDCNKTLEQNLELSDGDLLLFAVALVERAEPAWLEVRLKDPSYTTEARTTVGLELRGPLRRPVLTALGVPLFVIG